METKKHELLRRIEELEQRRKDDEKTLQEMKKQLEELEKEIEVSATGVYSKTANEKDFWYLDFTNKAIESNFDNDEVDSDLIKINNCFATEEQAEQESLRREGQEFIRRCAMLWNKDNDWRKKFKVEQYYICFASCGDFLVQSMDVVSRGEIWFDTKELAEKCIAELKAKYNEEQIKTIFGVK